ncbi:MAG: TrkA family potassium uptake protein [Prevotellaceae bacterium]|jgi:trk system potassium uptake protein TrkA|nr:TrkA family potassium uptake protein [Prevotellaceae bacterium]
MSVNKFAVIGIGHFGRSIALNLSRRGADVMAIDCNYERIEHISDEVSYAVTLDATDKKALLSQNIRNFDAVIVAIGSNFEQRLLCAALLLDLGIKRVICRAMGRNQRIILEKMGIEEILSPEDEVGMSLARRLMNPCIISFLDLSDDYCVTEISAPKLICGVPLGEIDLRDRYRLSLITVKRAVVETCGDAETEALHVIGVPDTKTVIREKDTLILFGRMRDVEKFVDINN